MSDILTRDKAPDVFERARRNIELQRSRNEPPAASLAAVSPVPRGEAKHVGIAPLTTPEGRTDLSNARRFAHKYADKVRYCYQRRSWLAWDGKRWAWNNEIVDGLAKGIADDIWNQAGGDSEICRFAALTSTFPRIKSMTMLAQSEPGISVQLDKMDRHPWLLNCLNGTVDLKTGDVLPHDPSDMITQICPTLYDPHAQAPTWMRFLDDVFVGDKDLQHFMQQFLGYCLTGVTTQQLLPFLWGDGSNGKSTLITAFMDTLGTDYAMQAAHGMLMTSKNDRHPTELADLLGKRFVSVSETGKGRSLDEVLVKQLTGSDRVRARNMYKDFFEFEPTHKLVMATNNKPRVTGSDYAIWRRIACIPFVRKFEGKQLDKDMPKKLHDEAPGILAWAVTGCLDWQQNKLTLPNSVKAVTDEYRREEDVIERFVHQHCTAAPSLQMRFNEFYKRLDDWCKEEDLATPTKREAGAWLKTRYKEKSSNGRCYEGIGLKEVLPF